MQTAIEYNELFFSWTTSSLATLIFFHESAMNPHSTSTSDETITRTSTMKKPMINKNACIVGLGGVLLLSMIVAMNTFNGSKEVPTRRILTLIDENVQLEPLLPLEIHDYFGFFLAILGLVVAAGGGIGGGGILVPIYILILHFPVKHAISLSSVTVLGGAVAINLLNRNKTHPDDEYHDHDDTDCKNDSNQRNPSNGQRTKRPCVDWDLLLQLEPPTIAGTLIGATLNAFLPGFVLVCLLLTLLTLIAYKTLSKAVQLYEKETQVLLKEQNATKENNSQQQQEQEQNHPYMEDEALLSLMTMEKDATYGALLVPNGVAIAPEYVPSSASSSSSNPLKSEVKTAIAKMVGLFLIITVLTLLKGGPSEGGNGSIELIRCGGKCYWYSQLVMLIIIGVFGVWTRSSILHRLHVSSGPILSDINWNESNTIHYPMIAIFAGLVAGLFGIGGGIIKGPLMLELGVHPTVASATSSAMILFTSAIATISYSIYGFVQYDYATACFMIGFISAWFGQTLMTFLMKRYQRPSYIAFSIGIVVAISAICMTIQSVLAIL